ncbi:MAG: competence type IV pilus minor pilin ComGD [Bacillus sp. (in: firmicutes)]
MDHNFYMPNDARGFTLIEMLFVLFILLILVSVTVSGVPDFMEKRKTREFVEQFTRDLHFAQSYSLNRQSVVSIKVDFARQSYSVVEGYNTILISRKLPEFIRISDGSLKGVLYYSANGHIRNPGSWEFKSVHYHYKFTVHLGRGRLHYAEL